MKPEKILLIDAEKNVLLTYKPFLEEEGYHVDIAINEDEAREKISQHTFAVVITELYLKGSDTLGIIRSLQKNTPEIYIIVLTGSNLSTSTYETVLEAGCQDCFMKPFPAKNPYPKKSRFQKKGQQCFNCQRRAKNITHKPGIFGPVHSELKLLYNPGYNPHCKIDQK